MKRPATAAKFSVSIPAELAHFLEVYQQTHDVSRSDAVARGLRKLRDAELAETYQAHAEAWAHNPEKDFWDRAAVDDGLDAAVGSFNCSVSIPAARRRSLS